MKSRYLFILSFVLLSCGTNQPHPITSVTISDIYQEDLSIRSISLRDNYLFFGTSKSVVGRIDLTTHQQEQIEFPDQAFRATAVNSKGYFALSIDNPAQLYKIDEEMNAELVYTETGEGVFYDALHFVTDEVGFALGDNYEGCISILKTVDSGASWTKLSCDLLPLSSIGEGAFAASNTNIESVNNQVWMATTKGNVYHSTDLGTHWKAIPTPIVNGSETHGIYSMDFYDENLGIIYGGDYTKPKMNTSNIALTTDGGARWNLIADGTNLGYKSCVQFVPNSNGTQLIAVGFTGIAVSNDNGNHWSSLSEEGFYTLVFKDPKTAYAAGNGRIVKLEFN